MSATLFLRAGRRQIQVHADAGGDIERLVQIDSKIVRAHQRAATGREGETSPVAPGTTIRNGAECAHLALEAGTARVGRNDHGRGSAAVNPVFTAAVVNTSPRPRKYPNAVLL
ncbi:hypothetical protein [Streptomyces sp. NPDC093093]|uniref:hypothetical protein n=1 Tax=Streptomyces sp. NPDC093093 TaxID=3366025 RepID=UPI00380DEBC6